MIPAYLRASKVSQLPGVRAALLVESITATLAALARRNNALTKNLRASFSYSCETQVHFALFINGAKEGLFRLTYDPESFEPPTLVRLTQAEAGQPVHAEPAHDKRARALEKLFSHQLGVAHASIWAPLRNTANRPR